MSGMSDIRQQNDKPQDYKEKVFIGKVVVTDDIKKFHRIKCEVPDLWDEYGQDELPWCVPAFLPGGCGPTEYSQNIPETGSFVYITLQNGDNHFPMYWGGVRDYKTLEGVLHENYPHRIGWQVNSYKEVHAGDERPRVHVAKEPPEPHPIRGHHFYLDRKTNDLEYEHASKTRVHIDPGGSIYLEVRDKKWPDGGDLKIDTDRDMIFNVGLAKSAGRPGNWLVDVVEGFFSLHVAKYWDYKIDQDMIGLVKGSYTETILGSKGQSVNGSITNSAGGAHTLNGATITLNAATVTINANTTNNGTLEVRDDTNLKAALNVTNDTDLKANLHVGGDATIDGSLSVGGGSLDVSGGGNFGGALASPTIDQLWAAIDGLAASVSAMQPAP